MGCYEDHLLLAYLDGELKSEGMAVESHLRECDQCQARMRALANDQQYLEGVLSEHTEEIELGNAFKEESWIRLKFRLTPNKGRRPKTTAFGIGKTQRRLVAAAVVVLLIGSLSLGSVRGAVADLLSVFRVDKIETIAISPQEMAQIDEAISTGIGTIDIDNFGTIKVDGPEETAWDCTVVEAQDHLDFRIISPALEGYGEPQARIKKYANKSLTLNVAGINSIIRGLGGTQLLPPELDQQTIALAMSPQLFLNYNQPGLPSLSMVQMRSPELAVPGKVEVEKVRDALLSLPFWPEGIRQQLAGINDWRHTMVIPETVNSQPVTVRGNQGIIWNDPEPASRSSCTTVLWSENGVIYSISGPLPLEQILEIAEGMN